MTLRLVQGWRGLAPDLKGAAVALGNFDGVHHGHLQVLADAAKAARQLNAPLGVIRFSPHPARAMRPDLPPFLLMSPNQQVRTFAELGVDRLYDLPFDADLSALSDADFAQAVLTEGLGVRHVSVGFDISFGKNRAGDAAALARHGQTLGFGVSVSPAVADPAGGKYASSAAREAIRAGDMARATAILGRPFAIEGVVVEGQKLGRTIGFPTANVGLGDYVRPRLGVYATRTRLSDGRILPGVANVGENPTTGLVEARLEVWLFDFDEDIYGQTLETELAAFLRPELKFNGLEPMVDQIKRDAAQARALLAPPF